MTTTAKQKVLALARSAGLIRPREVEARGLPGTYLAQLAREGRLSRIGRGIYRAADAPAGEHESLAEACMRVPRGVVCLLSALSFHDLTTQVPSEVWMAINSKAWKPRPGHLPIRVVYYSSKTLAMGLEEHKVGGGTIRLFSPAKTIVDCFKYRRKIGLDVAIEALRDGWRRRRCSIDELWRYARLARVHNVMRPYLEALVS